VPVPAAVWLFDSALGFFGWVLIIGIIPIVAAISWISTKDTKVFIMILGALLFVGAPWLVSWIGD